MLSGSSGLFSTDELLHPKSQGDRTRAAALSIVGWVAARVPSRHSTKDGKTLRDTPVPWYSILVISHAQYFRTKMQFLT